MRDKFKNSITDWTVIIKKNSKYLKTNDSFNGQHIAM